MKISLTINPEEVDEAISFLRSNKKTCVLHEIYTTFRNKWKYSETPPGSWEEVRELLMGVEGFSEELND